MQSADGLVAVDPHARAAVGDVRHQQKEVRLLAAEVHAGAERALLEHEGLGDVRQPGAVDAVREQAPVAHKPPDRRRDRDHRLLCNEDAETAGVVARQVAADAVGELTLARGALF